MPHAQLRLDPPREPIDPQRHIDHEVPGGLMESFWNYLALAMGIPPFPRTVGTATLQTEPLGGLEPPTC